MVREQRATFPVVAEPASVGDARRFVRAALYDWDADVFEESATLLVSEVVTNVLLHARTEAALVVRLDGDRLRVEVHDGSRLLPTAKHYGVEATTGRGVGLLDAMSAAWGVEVTGSGKVVWFELVAGDLSEAGAEPAEAAAWFDEVDLDDLEAALGGGRPLAPGPDDGDADPSLPAHDLGWRVLQAAAR